MTAVLLPAPSSGRVPPAPHPAAAAVLLAVLVAVPVVLGGSLPALALPPDPERPFDATTCDAALARLEEACAGSPLISAEAAAGVLEQARAQARRLCGKPAALPQGAGVCAPRNDDSSQR